MLFVNYIYNAAFACFSQSKATPRCRISTLGTPRTRFIHLFSERRFLPLTAQRIPQRISIFGGEKRQQLRTITLPIKA